jgi:hypothetical protein
MIQKPQITFEFEETIVLKQGGKLIREFCPRCEANGDLVSPDILALVTGASEREIFRLIECGAIHFIESGRLVACLGCYREFSARNEPTASI